MVVPNSLYICSYASAKGTNKLYVTFLNTASHFGTPKSITNPEKHNILYASITLCICLFRN